ncbi:hypothetical protein BDR26DRAFT_815616 [Obelidium mucronatum]|nr:hypothetical protein BDR26DRAFT_815616 [Obelidium mucronatum]
MNSTVNNNNHNNNNGLFQSADAMDENDLLDFDELFLNAFQGDSNSDLNSLNSSSELELQLSSSPETLLNSSVDAGKLNLDKFDEGAFQFGITPQPLTPTKSSQTTTHAQKIIHHETPSSTFPSVNASVLQTPSLLHLQGYNKSTSATKVNLPNSQDTLRELGFVSGSYSPPMAPQSQPQLLANRPNPVLLELSHVIPPLPLTSHQEALVENHRRRSMSLTANTATDVRSQPSRASLPSPNYFFAGVPKGTAGAEQYLPRKFPHLSIDTTAALINYLNPPSSNANMSSATPNSSNSYVSLSTSPMSSTLATSATSALSYTSGIGGGSNSLGISPSKQKQSQTFKCPIPGCTQTFHKKMNLTSHLKTHKCSKVYSCQECAATFRRSHDLRRHAASLHSEEGKAFSCLKCPKRFARLDALKRHVSRLGNKCFIDLGEEGAMQRLAVLVEEAKRNNDICSNLTSAFTTSNISFKGINY